MVSNPIGAIKALLDAQTREMYELAEGVPRQASGELVNPRNAVAASLLAFLARKKTDGPFTRGDYQDALRALRRTPDELLARASGVPPRQLPAWIKHLREELTRVLKKASDRAGRMAARHAEAQADALGVATHPISEDAVVRQGSKYLDKRMSGYAAEQAEKPYLDLKRKLALGVAAGLTLGELMASLMRFGGRKGPLPDINDARAVANAVADSMFGVASRSTRRMVVTEVTNAYNVQMMIAMDGLGITLKRWDSSNDLKVCRECRRMHGVVIELHRDFSALAGQGPPLHPNCRCALTVWTDKRTTRGED